MVVLVVYYDKCTYDVNMKRQVEIIGFTENDLS